MNKQKDIDKIIQQLRAVQGIRIECPHCEEEMTVRQARLFNMYSDYPSYATRLLEELKQDLVQFETDIGTRQASLKETRRALKKQLESKPKQVKVSTESINFGQITEKIIPSFAEFPYRQTECRSLFDPIDYVIFDGLSKAGKVESIRIVEVKSGGASLNQRQREIRDAVKDGHVYHQTLKRNR